MQAVVQTVYYGHYTVRPALAGSPVKNQTIL